MNVFIVHAHPEPQSFNSALKDRAVSYFGEKGDAVKVSDLYRIRFNPVGDRHDFKSLLNPGFFKYQAEQVNAFQNDLFIKELREEMDKVLWADLIIFNFPLWWFSLPAILKGWVDRIFAMGFAYGAGKGVYDSGTFGDKKAMLAITTGGPEVAYGDAGRNGNLNDILYHIQHGMLYFTGMKTLPPFVAWSPARLTDEERKAFLDKYEERLKQIDTLQPVF